MATKTNKAKVKSVVVNLLEETPEGLRFSALTRGVKQEHPNIPDGTIGPYIYDLEGSEIYKPSKGFFRLKKYEDQDPEELVPALVVQPAKTIKEDDFYEPFAIWLQQDLEECNRAIALGGSVFKHKWGTPDVIGVRESPPGEIIQHPTEVVSAEIKLELSQMVTAFGQACAYCLFSHKSYLVVPMQIPQDELSRLDSLCTVFGIGLVLFDASSPESPSFQIRTRPRKYDPDLFFTNKYLRIIRSRLFPR